MTNKVNNKIIILSLEILTILALGVIVLPTIASAEYSGRNYTFGTFDNDPYYNPTPYQAPAYIAPATTTTPASAPTIYSSSANPSVSATPKKTTTAKAKPAAPSKMAYIAVPLDSISNTLPAGAIVANTNDNSLAANALFATNSFMPSGIIQWLLFAILVLLIVILVRKIIGADKNYLATPLKHD